MATERNALAALASNFHKFNVWLLAEKVETQDEFDYCSDLGFDYFQGYFFLQTQAY
jgi:EAL and modified HD-GYP domain-containing signal transduction protein